MAIIGQPSFSNAYIVSDRAGSPILGVVYRTGHVWRHLQLGLTDEQQSTEVFALRGDAAAALVSLAQQAHA